MIIGGNLLGNVRGLCYDNEGDNGGIEGLDEENI